MGGSKRQHLSRVLWMGLATLWASCHPPIEPLSGSCADCNVLIISVDTLRADHLGAYGYPKPTSPFIDSIAERGVLFEKAFTPRGLTRPSMVSMLTSLYPVESGVRTMVATLSDEIPTIAHRLRASGYSAVSFRAGPLARFRDMGFQQVVRSPDAGVTDLANTWLDRNQREKFFLWLHYNAPHDDYQPPKEFDRFTEASYSGPYDGSRQQLLDVAIGQVELDDSDYRHLIGLYDGEIAYVDSLIREVFGTMEKLQLLEKTIVIFVSDHGEDLYQHNRYFQHMYSIYDSSLRIPLLLLLPERLGVDPARIGSIVEIIDIAPTLFDLIGEPIPREFAGTSLLPLVDGTSVDAEHRALSELWTEDGPGKILSIRTDRWRYIDNPSGKQPKSLPGHGFYPLERAELYDLQQDPNETTNVVDRFSVVASSLREQLRSAYSVRPKREAGGSIDAETVEQLRVLGYVQ